MKTFEELWAPLEASMKIATPGAPSSLYFAVKTTVAAGVALFACQAAADQEVMRRQAEAFVEKGAGPAEAGTPNLEVPEEVWDWGQGRYVRRKG